MTGLRLRLTAVLAVVASLLGAGVARLLMDLSELRDTDAAAREATAAARAYAADMLSYDYRTIEEDLARARAHATGPLARQYATLATTLPEQTRRQQTVQEAAVAGAAVESAERDRVQILVLLNTTTTKIAKAGAAPAPEVVRNRARLVMVRVDGRWLVSDLSTLLGDTPVR